jgi:hypothetical protein
MDSTKSNVCDFGRKSVSKSPLALVFYRRDAEEYEEAPGLPGSEFHQ